MILVRVLALVCLAVHSLEPGLSDGVSLLQTTASKKQKQPPMKPLTLAPPWAKIDAAAFAAMKSDGMAMLNRTALELNFTAKPEGDLLGEGMRFSLAGKHEGQDVDLLLKAVNTKGPQKFSSGKLKASKNEYNGLYNGFARVFIKSGTSQQLKMSVVKANTTEPLTIPLLAVSFFSLGANKGKNPTSVADCNNDLVSEFWASPTVTNETGNETGDCGGMVFKGTGQVKGKGKSDPLSVAEVGDEHCWNSLVFRWFDAEELTLELTAGEPAGKKGIPFIFRVGLTKCDVTWEPPPTKAELKALKKAEKAAEKAAKEEAKAIAAEEKAKAKAAKEAAKAAKR